MKVYIETLGCPKNTVDSQAMEAILLKGGHTVEQDPEQAEILIVNTCAFIKDAKEESIEAIFDLAMQKQADGKKLIVTGCLAQRYVAELYDEMLELGGAGITVVRMK